MPFALLIIGAFLLIAAVRGKTDGPDGLFALVAGDFTGPASFVYWMVAILIIGSIGYIPKVKPVTTAFLGLLILVLFLAKGDPSKAGGGFFEKFTEGLASTTTAKAPATTAAAPAGYTLGTPVSGRNPPGTYTGATGRTVTPGTPTLDNALDMLHVPSLGSLASDIGGWVN